jgi:hypothetical protein
LLGCLCRRLRLGFLRPPFGALIVSAAGGNAQLTSLQFIG